MSGERKEEQSRFSREQSFIDTRSYRPGDRSDVVVNRKKGTEAPQKEERAETIWILK